MAPKQKKLGTQKLISSKETVRAKVSEGSPGECYWMETVLK